MTTISELFSRTAARLSVIFALLIGSTVLAGVSIIYWQLSAGLEERIKLRVIENRDALSAIDSNDGFAEVTEVVKREAASRRAMGTILLLVDRAGTPVAGNVSGIPAFRDWRILKETELERVSGRSNPEDSYYALWTPLSQGTLLVGDSDKELRVVQSTLLGGLLWELAALVILATASGVLIARRAQMQIDAISGALTAVANGRLGQRVARRYSGDDLDRVAEQINGTLDHLQRLIERVDQSSTDIAHDLKRPIGRLRQKLDIALRTATDASAFRREIGASLEELDVIVETFEALLRIAQIEAGARRERFHAVDLGSLVTEVADIYRPVVEDAGDVLAVDVSGYDGPPASGDSELLIQLVVNLIENAIRHCPTGTMIRVALEGGQEGPRIVVADNGPGIPASERENVFHRLYRLEKSRSTPGSGLGLSLVAAIADLHGAKVTLADNRPGLVVEIDFPRPSMARSG
ncbi:signal transduction histidine kinase [Sinorhizobium terangae]|uniref:histidine kinase n=1 Tax=Sinorhizobium terangae TaxID=110322 RepID=A0A6N7LKY7_SINTE|nr:HAMP domain-containing sensor histidine kinase [Sinorhizobium terangae]MBB4187904.1 signal transduction histidine kinase [Sinorhizobium terangae]MQX18533.1 sensor histidine kinase [Sinorhizobium terangae]